MRFGMIFEAPHCMKVLASALEGLDKAIDDLEGEITSTQSEMVRLLDKVPEPGLFYCGAIASPTGQLREIGIANLTPVSPGVVQSLGVDWTQFK
jgi:hypothetical protein